MRDDALSDEVRVALHHKMLESRLIEERMLVLLRQGGISKWFSGIGQEAVSVGVTMALEADDFILPMHRNLGVFVCRRVDRIKLFSQLLGRAGGHTRGRDRSFHFGDLANRIVGMISHLGAMCPVACGLALGAQLNGQSSVAVTFIGDGATSEGDVHEAMNLAAVWRLPVIFLIENNQYGLSTPTHEQFACERLSDRAVGYGMPGETIDGNDVDLVYRTIKEAANRARGGGGPSLIECLTFRTRGHEEASGTAYVPASLQSAWAERDPLLISRRRLVEDGVAQVEAREKFSADLDQSIRADLEQARASAAPNSNGGAEVSDVYAPSPRPHPAGTRRQRRRFIDAIRDALFIQLERDPSSLLMGQDIAEYGGVFKASEGLLEAFGRARVRNTPIIESGAIGAALGLALSGLRPAVEIQFADFITCGFNQIVNNLAKTHYRWSVPVPVVIRAPHGGGVGAGPFHSQSVEAWFTRVPGLKVVCPATPTDAKGLLLSAFADPNPVLFLEHKKLYRSITEEVPNGYFTIPFGEASIRREGADLTIITYGVGVEWALNSATKFGADAGIEVIDLRSLIPWDTATVFASVKKTGRALVLHEDSMTGGFGAELAAAIGSACFEWLDAPIERVGALDTPIPFSPALESDYQADSRLDAAIRAVLAY